MDLKDFFENGHRTYLPNLSIDLVIIGYEEEQLKCLLLKVGSKWLLPGGYIRRDQSVEAAARFILRERTGLDNSHLKFLQVFGDSRRQFGFSEEWKNLMEEAGMQWQEDLWINDRFVALTYYSLVNIHNTHPSIKQFDEAFHWFPFDALPDIWLDHRDIVLTARDRLKEDINQELITHNLLPDHFTMPELHRLHQTILGEPLERSRFQKKMLATDLFERLPKAQVKAPGRNPYLYRLKPKS